MEKHATCLVTGCAGFVGSHLVEALLQRGHNVIGVDNFFSGYRHNMANFAEHPRFVFYEEDIRASQLLKRLRDDHPELSVLYHLAAIVSVPYSVEHPEETLEVNLKASRDLYEEAQALNFETFVFAGSAAEYGEAASVPIPEDAATPYVEHASPYGEAKYLISKCIEDSSFGTSLRFFNIYGPRQDPSSPYSGVISKFLDCSLAGEPMTVLGDGKQTRDFIYIEDVIRVYLAVAGLGDGGTSPVPGVFNVATGKETSIVELAETVGSLTGNTKEVFFGPPRVGDIKHSVADITQLEKAIGHFVSYSLEKGLHQTLFAYMGAAPAPSLA